MIASLPMYQRPQLAATHNLLWRFIRERLAAAGIDSPVALSIDKDELSTWTDPKLVLSQTCGMPYRSLLHDRVNLVGTPDYAVDGCAPGYYRSAIVVRANDPRQHIQEFESAIFAYNDTMSQSGFAAPYWHCRPHGFWFQKRFQTQRHVDSARAVATGEADIASLDAVTWRHAERYEGFCGQLRVLDWTAPTPGLPYICSPAYEGAVIFDAVREAIAALPPEDREQLGLRDLIAIPSDTYLAFSNPEDETATQ